MSIILRIREFLRLDKKTLLISTDFTDSVGLYMIEGMARKIEHEPMMDCLINHHSTTNSHHNFIPNSHSFDSPNLPHDLHF
jgi:hypothetical protein